MRIDGFEYHGVSGDNSPYFIPKTSIVYAKFSEKTGMINLYLIDDTELRIILDEDTLNLDNNNLIFNK